MMRLQRPPGLFVFSLSCLLATVHCGGAVDELVEEEVIHSDDHSACDHPAPDDVMVTDEAALGGETAPLASYSPERAECVGHVGPNACWSEWLKEVGDVGFTPVAKGGLGAGVWPTTALVTMGRTAGIDAVISAVSVDTGQNIYAVSAGALYVRRTGSAVFEKYPRATHGLRDFPLLSVAGAGPGVAYVGYVGIVTAMGYNDPPEIARSGDVQRIDLVPGDIVATTYDTHNSNYARSGLYDHVRTVYEIVVPRRGPAAGEVYLGSEHAVARYQGLYYVDHRHISATSGTLVRYGAARALTVTDDGTMWYGSEYMMGGLAFTPRMYEWYFANKWILPTNAYGSATEKENYEGIGVDSKGHVWGAARGFGLVHLLVRPDRRAGVLETLAPPDLQMRDLVVDLDDTIWIATNSGLRRYDPVLNSWTKIDAAGYNVKDLFLDDTVTPRAIYAATSRGIFVYRGP